MELGFRTKIFQEMRLQTKQGPYSGCTFLTEAKQYEAVKQGLKEFNGSVVKVYNDMTPQKKRLKYHTNGSTSSIPAVIDQIFHTVYNLGNLEE